MKKAREVGEGLPPSSPWTEVPPLLDDDNVEDEEGAHGDWRK